MRAFTKTHMMPQSSSHIVRTGSQQRGEGPLSCLRCMSTASNSFHKRPLPKELIAFSSPVGKAMFREALNEGGMESYFALSEQFVTQSEPAYCAFSSLAMVLNALNFDPRKVWKGAWRWVSEDMLTCESPEVCTVHQKELVIAKGMNFKEFELLGQCHGVCIKSYPAIDSDILGIEAFRKVVSEISSSDKAERFIVVNFSRKSLSQTGGGHFSPVGGYLPSKDLVLIMDTARFKYPPFWVSLTDLWKAMTTWDIDSDSHRGYFIVSTMDAINDSNSCDPTCTHIETCSIAEDARQKVTIPSASTCGHHHHSHDHKHHKH
jgi:glutathione gamma-glutamylcysteinyltransferase